MSTELDDDEVLVYDWRNAGVPRPAGTTRLGDGGSYSSQSVWNEWATSPSPAFQSNSVGIQNHHYSTGTGNWYNQMTAHQMQYGYPLPYSGQYQAMYGHSLPAMSYPTYGNPSPSAYYNNGGYTWGNYYYDQGRASQGPLDNQMAAKKPKKKVVEESKDNDLFDVEEFDYSDSKYRTPEGKSTKSKEAHKSKVKARSPAKDLNKSRNDIKSPTDNSFQVDEIDYSIPLPTVPLNEILPGFGSKVKSPSKAACHATGSRKRPRTELETELIDLISKKGGRASARSYAKPSRKVSTPTTRSAVPSFPTPAASVSSIVNEDLQCAPGPGPTSRVIFTFPSASPLSIKSQSPDKSFRQPTPEPDQTLSSPLLAASANQSFEEVRPTIIDTSLHDVGSESESEVMEFQIKIRSDIFEDEDDED